MYRLLIVDDEDHLRNLIANQIDWQGIGFEITCARDGKEALEVAKEFRPDALLTDIRMPFIDGLELIRLLKVEIPGLFTVVLSGHDEFDYAKNSLQMGVTDYLLKPIRPSMLISTMTGLKEKMDEAARQQQDIEHIRLQLEESMPFLRQQYLMMLLHESQPEALIRQQFEYLGIELVGSAYALCLFDHSSPANPADRFFTYFAVQEILKKQFPENAVCFFDNAGLHYIICGLSGEKHEREAISALLENAIQTVCSRLSLTATAAVGSDVVSLSCLSRSCQTAFAALDGRVVGGKGKVYDAKDYLLKEDAVFRFSFQNAMEILTRLPFEQPDVFCLKLDALFAEIRSQNCTDITYLHIIFADLISNAHKILSEYKDSAGSINGNIYHELFSLKTLDEMQELASQYIMAVKNQIDAERSEKQQSLIGQAHDYIDQNFCDSSLSLSNVAQMFYVSPSYLSNLFKRKYNMNFVEYVTRLRMEKAKQLLASSALKTYEIAEQTGYNDPQYFSNSFKKYTGLTPSEYKADVAGKQTS
ncbi:response regulator [Christensenellaceae bacterium OttesenSCG-928-K19]|nr:response regulator [Christensenellaceae bacterium OttesenSCG-928-K19]